MNHMEDALPARKPREFCRKFPVVSESIIRGLLHIGGRRAAQGEVNHQRPGHNLLARNKAPGARIVAVIAVVAENKILARGHHQFALELSKRTQDHPYLLYAYVNLGLTSTDLGNYPKASEYLTLALEAGLDSAILDPLDRELKAALIATELLLNRDRHCLTFTRAFRAGLLEAPKPKA